MLKTLATVLALSACLAQTADFKEKARFTIGGDGLWDYLTLDAAGKRLYVARETRVAVVDTASGKLVGEVPGLDGAHGVALVPELGLGFASSGKSGTVVAFDLEKLETRATIGVGRGADAILYDPASKLVFVFNAKSRDASVIDPKTKKVLGTIALPGKPEFGVSDGKGKIYVNLETTSELARIDARKLALESRIPLAPCTQPTGLAIDRETGRLFAGCRNRKLVVVDPERSRVLKSFDVGSNVDGVAFDPKRKLVFVPGGDGTMVVLREKSPEAFELHARFDTKKGARTIALDPESGRVYVVTADRGPAVSGEAHASVLPGTFVVLVY
ncbi:MAG: YncE family protein [Deltaproteobacteria bacterium]|nr:YncE family protein [Deltaproteobacteria bacterium]